MKADAEILKGETVVLTFYPHPRLVLNKDVENLKFINTQEKKIERLEAAVIDHLIIIQFTKEFSELSSEQFLKQYIIDKINPKKIVIGYDHHFGKNRRGTYDLLLNLGHHYNFSVEKVEPLVIEGITVSSTKIRNLLKEGRVSEANRLLGYEYSITGKVVRGNGIGRTIGFPTANISIKDEYKLIAANGVYACRVELDGEKFSGMGNIGTRPTIDHGELTIEVNIFDFDRDIYDKEITISFVNRMRNEIKFDSLEALKEQLIKDRENTLSLLRQSY
jgi:riboflavin kinase/FMN adenylyltransferase